MKTTNFKNKKSPSCRGNKNVNQASATAERATKKVSLFRGCEHDCKYCCYKSMSIRFKHSTPDNWKEEAVDCTLLHVVPKPPKEGGYTLFPSNHDITPDNFGYAIHTISLLLEGGHRLLLATKPHLCVIQEIESIFSDKKDQILFRFSIGSSDSTTLKFWEPYAPTFEERLSALQFAFYSGYQTSVSCEPILDTNTEQLIDELLPYVTDTLWVGLPYRFKRILQLNGADDPETLERADKLILSQSDDFVRKLYSKYHENPKIKWKDSILKIIGIERPIMEKPDICM